MRGKDKSVQALLRFLEEIDHASIKCQTALDFDGQCWEWHITKGEYVKCWGKPEVDAILKAKE